MPQLDTVTFSTQIFWFCLVFFTTFFVFLGFLLPEIKAALRARSFFLESSSTIAEHLSGGVEKTEAGFMSTFASLSDINSSIFKGYLLQAKSLRSGQIFLFSVYSATLRDLFQVEDYRKTLINVSESSQGMEQKG